MKKNGRKTVSIEQIKSKLPLCLSIIDSTYKNTQTYAIFVDNEYGEFKAKPHDIINRGRKHPKRNLKKGGGNAPPRYSVLDIKKQLKDLYDDFVILKEATYNGIGENCIFLIDGEEYQSKPSRVLNGQLPRMVYLSELQSKNMLSIEDFKVKLSEIRDDVVLIEESYSPFYKKNKSQFQFKNFVKPVWLLPISILNGASHPSERARQALEVYFNKTGFHNPSQNPEVRKKIFQKQEMSLPEKKISLFLKNRGFDFKYNSQLNEIGKFWDFIIHKDGKPKLVIEIDGEFVHGLTQDANSSHVNGTKDSQRFQKLDNDIIYLQCDSRKTEELQIEILRVFDLDYEKWVKEIVDYCQSISFPYPSYEDKRMKRDYQNLCQQQIYKRNFYTGNSIIINFHKSLYHSHREGQLSPFLAWQDKKILERCVKNRFIYSSNLSSVGIARGFEMNRIASRVSVFQPSLARMILERFKGENVIDPFSGFSGRMLGATSLDITYHGFDIRQEVIDESRNIVNLLELKNVKLDVKDIINDNYDGEYDLLFTCPPYENKEIWFKNQKSHQIDYYIDLCLQKIKAKTYIFVIDDVETKYEKMVKDYVYNNSHFGRNKEKLLVI